MSGIKKDSVTVNHSVITDFTKDMGFFQVKDECIQLCLSAS